MARGDELRILVRTPNWLGDTMMATPTVARVKRFRPGSRVTVLCRPAFEGFWRSFPGVDDVMVLGPFIETVRSLKARAFDEALILPTSFSSALMAFAAGIPRRTGYCAEGRFLFLTTAVDYSDARTRHLVLEYLDLLPRAFPGAGVVTGPIALEAPRSKEARRAADSLLRSRRIPARSGLIGLGAGATYGPAKRWPVGHWRDLIGGLLASRPESLVLLGGSEEEPYLHELLKGMPEDRVHGLAGRTPLPVLAEVLRRCRIFITNDTGPQHVAAAVGTPVLALFGSTSPRWTRPWGRGHRVLQNPVPCSPCFQRRCNIGYPCLQGLSPETVLAAALNLLKRGGRVSGEPYST